jgi:hypothetical protein
MMSTRERVCSGAVGSVIPLLASVGLMPRAELTAAFTGLLDTPVIVGLAVKIVASVTVGGVVCYMRTQISDRWTAFLWGALAVGIFAGALTAGGRIAPGIFNLVERDVAVPPRFALVNSARAAAVSGPSADDAQRPYVYPLCVPRASEVRRFFSGLTGVFPNTLDWYWVIAPVSSDRQMALALRRRAAGISSEGDRKPRIFAASAGDGWKYIVSLGLNLSESDAADLAKSCSQRFGVPFRAEAFGSILQELSVTPQSLPVCHFSHDD